MAGRHGRRRSRIETKAACRATHREGLPDRPGALTAQRRAAPARGPLRPQQQGEPHRPGLVDSGGIRSGKSHLLSFIGAVALGDKKAWDTVNELETKAKKGKRESLYQFYESGLAKKSTGKSKGIFVAVKTLVGQGGGTIGVTDTGRKLTEYILDAVQDQYHAENGKTISVYPVEVLADRFEQDIERYRKDLGKFLKDPKVLRRGGAGRTGEVPSRPA